MLDIYEMMSSLRAVRRLKPDPVPEDVLSGVLQAVNACIMRPKDSSTLEKPSKLMYDYVRAYFFRSVWCKTIKVW